MDRSKRILITIIAVAVGIIFAIIGPNLDAFDGLSAQALGALGILLACIIMWIAKVLPESIIAIAMCISFIALCGVPTTSVFNTFATSTWWLLVAAFVIGFGMQKSGLMHRMAQKILGIFPNTFAMQALGLISAGTIIGPFIPSLAAKMTLLSPLCAQIATDMGYKMKERPAEGLFLAMYTGARNVAPVVVSASITGYALLATLPPQISQRFDLLTWAVYMIPWFVVISVLNLIAIIVLYRPKGDPIFRSRSSCVHKRARKAEPKSAMSSVEKKMAIIVGLCIILWMSEPYHHLQSHVVALAAMVVMVALGVVSMKEIKNNLAWDSLIFIGCVLGIAGVFSYLGIDQWIIERCYPIFMSISANHYLLVGGLGVITVMLRFIIVSDVALINILMAFLVSLSISSGINPWVVGIVIYVMSNSWFALYQNPIYLAAYYAVDGKMVRQTEMARYCAIYLSICLFALILSVPIWEMCGIISFIGN